MTIYEMPRGGCSRLLLTLLASLAASSALAQNPLPAPPGVIYKVREANQRLEMVVNTSRILTLDESIPTAQVMNRDLLDLTALSEKQIQVHAKKAGVTQINLWTERKEIFTIDVVVMGDAQELRLILAQQFPRSTLTVTPLANSVIVAGYVDRADQVNQIIQIAEDYHPKIINNITVGGVQQVQLDVKVMEVSRTKLRTAGMDWANQSGNDFVVSSVSGLLNPSTTTTGGLAPVSTAGAATFRFNIVGDNNNFYAALELMKRNNLVKVLAEPKIVTVSGRPARFQSGGEYPVPIAGPLGVQGVEFREFGTIVDFVPIVLGNGSIRLEVRPSVSEPNAALGTIIGGVTVPARTLRQIDTGVEMKSGQTLAIAGLVQTRLAADTRGIPWVSDLPYIGFAFRRNSETKEEIETLIMVTPHLVEPMDAHEVPPCVPGSLTDSPTDWELYAKGYIEVPKCQPPAGPPGHAGYNGNYGGGPMSGPMPAQNFPPDGRPMGPSIEELGPGTDNDVPPAPKLGAPMPGSTSRVQPRSPAPAAVRQPAQQPREAPQPVLSRRPPPPNVPARTTGFPLPSSSASGSSPAPQDPRIPQHPFDPRLRPAAARNQTPPAFIGPTGYDVVK